MELRDIEVFLTLAEELHFGRTAERLRLTPGRVSQVIKKQERRVGAPLFDRSPRHVALTAIGQQLYDELLPAYRGLHRGMDNAKQAAQQAARTTSPLRLGMFSWDVDVLRPFLDALAERRPGSSVQIRFLRFGDPFSSLRAGELDVMLPWLPIREPDLTVGPVAITQPIVLAMSASDPLAQQDAVSLEVLADRTIIGGATPDYWREAFIPTHTPSGRPITIGPKVASFDQMIPILLTGEAVGPVTTEAIRLAPHPGIAYPLIHDAAPVRFTLVWRTAAETSLVRAFADIITELGPLAL